MTTTRPRVGIVVASLDILGGQAVQGQLLRERLEGDGWEVTFVAINPRFPTGLGWLRSVRYARTVLNQSLYVPSLLRLRGCDVVHIFCASYWAFLISAAPALVATRAMGKRAVLNYHSGEADDHLARWGALVHPWLKLANEIVVPSEYLAGVFARHGYQARVIRNIVELDRFRFRERRTLRPLLLSNRNFESHYRVDNTLRAFALLKRGHAEAKITVAGQGPEESNLRALTQSLGVSDVSFVGRVAPEAMPQLYDSADVFVNSSVIDNQPLSVLEAFAAGLPVVSTATGDIAAMIRHGETGLLVPADDPTAMAGAIESLLARPDRAHEMTRRARDEVRHYTWTAVRDQWANVYQGAGSGAGSDSDSGSGSGSGSGSDSGRGSRSSVEADGRGDAA